jgi:hypothetical protein
MENGFDFTIPPSDEVEVKVTKELLEDINTLSSDDLDILISIRSNIVGSSLLMSLTHDEIKYAEDQVTDIDTCLNYLKGVMTECALEEPIPLEDPLDQYVKDIHLILGMMSCQITDYHNPTKGVSSVGRKVIQITLSLLAKLFPNKTRIYLVGNDEDINNHILALWAE